MLQIFFQTVSKVTDYLQSLTSSPFAIPLFPRHRYCSSTNHWCTSLDPFIPSCISCFRYTFPFIHFPIPPLSKKSCHPNDRFTWFVNRTIPLAEGIMSVVSDKILERFASKIRWIYQCTALLGRLSSKSLEMRRWSRLCVRHSQRRNMPGNTPSGRSDPHFILQKVVRYIISQRCSTPAECADNSEKCFGPAGPPIYTSTDTETLVLFNNFSLLRI